MPTLYDKDGNEVEAYTKEEFESEKTKILQENPEVKTLKQDLETAKKELEGFKDKDLNFANLKQAKEETEKKVSDLENKITEFQTSSVKSLENEVFNQLSNGDADLKAKLEAEYKTFRGEPKTKEEILAQAQKAMFIVKPPVVPGAFDAFSSSNGGRSNAGGTVNKDGVYVPNEAVKTVGGKMGITDDDFKKYGNK